MSIDCGEIFKLKLVWCRKRLPAGRSALSEFLLFGSMFFGKWFSQIVNALQISAISLLR